MNARSAWDGGSRQLGQKAVVALANKNARILWAVLTRDAPFDPDHVPMPPAARGGLRLQAAA
jgi:transposase